MVFQGRRLIYIMLFAGVLGLLGGFLFYQGLLGKKTAPEPSIPGFLWPQPKALTSFVLNDQEHQSFGLQQLKGKWTFLFFGYTHCPDVCPLTLSVLAEVERRLAESPQGVQDVQVVFVSLDPKRDTPKKLREYVHYFHHDFLGVTGGKEQLTELTRQLGIVYAVSDPAQSGDYLVDHSASVLLIDPQTRLVAVFGMPHDASTIANRFTAIREFLEG